MPEWTVGPDPWLKDEERICEECGNDLATEGQTLCSNCLNFLTYGSTFDPRDVDPQTGAPMCPLSGELVPECKRLGLCECTDFEGWD